MDRGGILDVLLFLLVGFLLWRPASAQQLSVEDILRLPVPPADHRIPYGSDPLTFGDLRLPAGAGPHPVVIVIHGGCWREKYSLDHIATAARRLTNLGVATWSVEYRRVGNPGGGWPGTFEDVAQGVDYLRTLARKHALDLNRVVVIGHSAGGHLALWVAARHRLPPDSPLYSVDPLPLGGVVALAGIPDLREAAAQGVCGDAIPQLLGGSVSDVPERYQQASPMELLPLGIPQRLVQGAGDKVVPLQLAQDYVAAGQKAGDPVELVALEDAGHFELIHPNSSAWPAVEEAVFGLTGLNREQRVRPILFPPGR